MNNKEQLSEARISRQQRSFLLLELLIALFLVGSCALPLACFPMRAIQEEIKSAYRMEMPRLADLAFAEFKEKLYYQEFPWDMIASSSENKATVIDDFAEISIDPVGLKKFKRTATMHSIGKKGKQGEEWRLVTFIVKFQPVAGKLKFFQGKKRNKKGCVFTYQVILEKILHITPTIVPENVPPPIDTG
jgi:hypothetical protein